MIQSQNIANLLSKHISTLAVAREVYGCNTKPKHSESTEQANQHSSCCSGYSTERENTQQAGSTRSQGENAQQAGLTRPQGENAQQAGLTRPLGKNAQQAGLIRSRGENTRQAGLTRRCGKRIRNGLD